MSREGAACFCHLHQAQHSLVHARAARSSNNNNRAALGSAMFNCSRDLLTDNGPHGRSEKTEIHRRDGHLVTIENSMSTDHSINETRAFMVIFQPIFVRGHSLKPQDVH